MGPSLLMALITLIIRTNPTTPIILTIPTILITPIILTTPTDHILPTGRVAALVVQS